MTIFGRSISIEMEPIAPAIRTQLFCQMGLSVGIDLGAITLEIPTRAFFFLRNHFLADRRKPRTIPSQMKWPEPFKIVIGLHYGQF